MTQVRQTLGTQVRRLIELLDGDLAGVYRDLGLDYRPRYTPVMRQLFREAPLSVGDLARRSGLTQPAVSQTLRQMQSAGLVEDHADRDGRVRLIALTDAGEALRGPLNKQWQATARAAAALDDQLSTPLSAVLAEAIAALEADPFADRIRRLTQSEDTPS
ncbi:MarR family winged helix-turn-helix transcriptional regulator [Maricaulis sp. CAU 1757]